ncbi:MAG: DNA-formamidopyrimidine glycosylase family protein, partial [Pseudomonadota bacterium]
MPELPEVETTRRGIEPHIIEQQLERVTVRNGSLRWPVPKDLQSLLQGQEILEVGRRGKYLLLRFKAGTLLMHLGMSGSLRVVKATEAVGKHDHVDLTFVNGATLRLNDPRRFGAVLWAGNDPADHC